MAERIRTDFLDHVEADVPVASVLVPVVVEDRPPTERPDLNHGGAVDGRVERLVDDGRVGGGDESAVLPRSRASHHRHRAPQIPRVGMGVRHGRLSGGGVHEDKRRPRRRVSDRDGPLPTQQTTA